MKPKATVQRKCLHCGFIYEDADMIFGIKKCPECFKIELFVYVDKKGKELPDYDPHLKKDNIDDVIKSDYKDTGCFLYRSCLGCPYEICAEEFKKSERTVTKIECQKFEPVMQKVTA